MKLIFLLLPVCIFGQEYNYKIHNKQFKCNMDIVNNLRFAISNELNLSYIDVEVSCDGLWSN